MLPKGFSDGLNSFFVVLFGIVGVAAPAVSIFVATFQGKSDIAMVNSTVLLCLSVLIIVFLVIKAFSLFFNNHKKLFLLDVLFLLLAVGSLIIHLGKFISL